MSALGIVTCGFIETDTFYYVLPLIAELQKITF